MNISKRIERIILLVRCIVRALFHGAANQISSSISRIIVVPTGKLGDVVCATPVLYAIRKHLPKARIIVAGNSKLHRPLLSDSGLVDEYFNLEEKGVVERIRKYRAEVALVTGPSFEPTALLYLAGIPLVVAPKVEGGFSPSETKPYKILQRFVKTYIYRIGEYAPRERLKALEPLGIISTDTTKHLGFSERADKKVKQFFIDNDINVNRDLVIGISPSAGNKIKNWGGKKFANLADYLYAEYKTKILIIGGSRDKEEVEEMIAHLNQNTQIVNTLEKFNIEELKVAISKMDLFISVDTGPIYIAEAFGVPTVDITGPIDEREQPPIGKMHVVVTPPEPRKPQLFVMNARAYNTKEALRQTESISVEKVTSSCNILIALIINDKGQRISG
ncbi:MAG: glycosyltransferase family 9 protein [Candidatus Levybacteria bacterium]|nr:glycosyltransferase family 9 protein [Candidatus Levybacteria bacterium]